MGKRRVFVIGMDGGSWGVIKPLVEMGVMPGMGELMSGGRHGVLLSTIPYISCPAWNCLASGKNPGWIGSFGFLNLAPASYDLRFYDYRKDTESPEIWDILGEQGLSCGVFNSPVVREPRAINGYMIPGFLADDRNYRTWPESMRPFIDDACGGYEIEPRGFSVMGPEKTIKECERVEEKRYRAFRAMLKEHPSDFFLGVFHLTDRVSHNVLNYTGLPLEPDRSDLEALTASFYEKLDTYISDLVGEYVKEEDLLVVLSDHGFAPCEAAFLLNSWLIKEGYLKLRPFRGLSSLGINQRKIAAVLNRFGLMKPAMKYTPRFLRRLIPEGRGTDAREKGSSISVVDYIQAGRVDWASTSAIAMPNHGIYLNTCDRPEGTVGSGEERESLIAELRGKLLAYTDPATGDKPISSLHAREELYSGPKVDRAPDLIADTIEGWTTQALMGDAGSITISISRADHRREGIVLLKGPGAGPGAIDGSIEDIAPTVIDFLGVKSQTAMDGSSLLK